MIRLGFINRLCLFSFLLFFSLSACPPTSRGQGKSYRIGPRDILAVTIFAGGEKQNEVDLTVSEKGEITAPFIGIVKAEGLTVNELDALIRKPLEKDYFVNPEVVIFIKEYHSLRYYISGAVKNPGLYETSSEASLMELIAKAGGLLPDRGNIAYILRASTGRIAEGDSIKNLMARKEPIKVDLKRLLDEGDSSCNLMLLPDDVVYIPRQKALDLGDSKVYVGGEVKNPGAYDFQPGLTALNACLMAGGFDKFAAPNRTKVIRKNEGAQETININLDRVKEGKIPDLELRPGDRIHIPEAYL
ncbi:MAG: polysaccharide biosynthesis/export family protein [Pseudomonadota bacterium]